jgi:hypothetical protein
MYSQLRQALHSWEKTSTQYPHTAFLRSRIQSTINSVFSAFLSPIVFRQPASGWDGATVLVVGSISFNMAGFYGSLLPSFVRLACLAQ